MRPVPGTKPERVWPKEWVEWLLALREEHGHVPAKIAAIMGLNDNQVIGKLNRLRGYKAYYPHRRKVKPVSDATRKPALGIRHEASFFETYSEYRARIIAARLFAHANRQNTLIAGHIAWIALQDPWSEHLQLWRLRQSLAPYLRGAPNVLDRPIR